MARAATPQGGTVQSLMRTKSLDTIMRQADEAERPLNRAMGTLGLTAFGVAAIIGAGIFVLTGQAAATKAGPGIILSYVAAGIASGLAALCYAELASTVPISGSAYTYSYAVLGELIAWIIGWDLILEYGVGAATVAIGWSGYLSDFLKSYFNATLPTSIAAGPFESPAGIINLPAFLVILAITALLIFGTRETSGVNTIIVAVKVAIVIFFIVVGLGHLKTSNWHPFLPFGVGGILSGASLIFFAYIGFDQVSTAAEEVRDPQKTMPRGILLSLGICTVLYMAVALVLTGIVKYTKLNNASPVSHAMLQIGITWAAKVITVGAIAGLTTVLLALLFGQSRIFFSMSRDGLLPPVFSHVHQTFRTPYISSLIVGIFVAVLAGLTPIKQVAEMTNIGTLAAFILVSIAVWRLRVTNPDLPRGFRAPLSSPRLPILPIASAIASFVLILSLAHLTWVRFIVWLAIGLVIYFIYSRHQSKLEATEPQIA